MRIVLIFVVIAVALGFGIWSLGPDSSAPEPEATDEIASDNERDERNERGDAASDAVEPTTGNFIALRGRVITQHGDRVADAKVELRRGRRVLRTFMTEKDGVYRFDRIAAGTLELRVRTTQGTVEPRTLDLVPGLHDNIDLTVMVAASVLEGSVIDENDDAIPGAEISLERNDEPLPHGPWHTDRGGAFTIELPPKLPPKIFVVARARGFMDASEKLGATPLTLVLEEGGPLSVEVQDRDGQPASAVDVQVVSRAQPGEEGTHERRRYRENTADDGMAHFPGVRSGSYQLFARSRGGAASTSISVEPAGTEAGIQLGGGGTIRGRLRYAGRPRGIAGAVVKLVMPDGLSGWRKERRMLSLTDREGHFVLESVPPGSWTVSVVHNLIEPTTIHDVVVREGEETLLDDVERERQEPQGLR